MNAENPNPLIKALNFEAEMDDPQPRVLNRIYDELLHGHIVGRWTLTETTRDLLYRRLREGIGKANKRKEVL